MRRSRAFRSGTAQVQWVVIAAVIALAILIAAVRLGNRTSTRLNQTAGDVANPSLLKSRFAP